MGAQTTRLRWLVIDDNIASLTIISVFGILIINCLFIDKGYYDTMATDLLSFIDGIYRVHLGQIPHRDFSTVQGDIQLLVPAYLVNLGAGLVPSIGYYHAVLLVLALCIVLYLQRTRIDNFVAVGLSALIALALACKYNFGDNPFQVTEAMVYDRIGFVFLTLQLILSIPPKRRTEALIITDGALTGLICGFLFYVKITFGAVALAFLFFSLLADGVPLRSKVKLICVALAAFFLVIIVMELGLGGRFSWYRDIHLAMLAESGSRLQRHFIVHKLAANAPEVVVGIVAPFVILALSGTRIRMYWVLYALAITVSSFVLLIYSAQEGVLFLPIAFIIFAMSKLSVGIRFNAVTGPQPYSLAMAFLSLFAIATIGYPMLVNIAFASESFHHQGNQLSTANNVLSSIRTLPPDVTKPGFLTSSQSIDLVESSTPLDGYIMARETRPGHHYELMTFPEVGFYLEEGLKAANSGCRKGSRIETLDNVNPFPALLGWPVGGGMIFVADHYLISKEHHLSDEEMFGQIDCVLIPKLQLDHARDVLQDIYGPYLQANFVKTGETQTWTVLSAKAAESKAAN